MQIVGTRRKRDCIVASLATVTGKDYQFVFDSLVILGIVEINVESELLFLRENGFPQTRRVTDYLLSSILYVKVPSKNILGGIQTVVWNGPNNQFIDCHVGRSDKVYYTEDEFFTRLPKCFVIEVC
jgi:hypothetical protein